MSSQRSWTRSARRLVVIGVLAGVVAAVASSAARPAVTAPRSHRGGVLIFDRTADFQNFSGNDVESNFVWDQITEPLFRNKPNGKGVMPWLATKYRRSKNGLRWTFKLRKGVTFSNGKPFTSADVKFTLENTMKSNDWGFVDKSIKKITTPKPLTVVIKTKYRWAPLLSDLAIFANAIIPNHFAGESRAQFYKAPIGTGPFEWDYWHKGIDLRLTRNPHYWVPHQPYLNAIDFRVVPNDNTRLLQLQTGQANIIESPAPSSVKQVVSNPALKLGTYPALAVDHLALNQTRPPLNNVHFRRAIDFAINRRAIVKAALFGHGKPANSMIMPNMVYYYKGTPGGRYDVAKAKAELSKVTLPANYEMQLLYAPSSYYQTTTAQLIQADLGAIGIKVKLVGAEQNALYGLWFKQKFDSVLLQWANDITDPDEWLEFALNPAEGSKDAFTSFNDPAVAKDVVAAGKALSTRRRAALYKKVQVQAAKNVNTVLLDYPVYLYAMQKKVHGFIATPTAEYRLQTVWLSK